MPPETSVISIDQGTTGTSAHRLRSDGTFETIAEFEHRQIYPQQGWVAYAQAAAIARRLAERYAAGEVDQVILVYSEFVSAISQKPREVVLLPFAPPADDAAPAADALPYEIEPSPEKLLSVLVPKALEAEITAELDAAWAEAQATPVSTVEESLHHVFAEMPPHIARQLASLKESR